MNKLEKTLSLHERLNYIQQNLKAKKNQRNTFGNYNYRSAEDILEAVKPLLGDTTLVVGDKMVNIGNRYYIKATAKLQNGKETIENTAYAREPEIKKGMDEAQITGATSSYARKYAMNGLFAIDDTKDADTMDNSKEGGLEAHQEKINKITNIEDLKNYYIEHEGLGADFAKMITKRKLELNGNK